MSLFAAINVEAVVIFAIVLSITLGITYWASKRATSAVGFYAAGRQITGAAERPGDLRRLPVGGLVPGHRRPDLPLRVRRVPVLDRVPRRVPDRDVPAGRAHAQRRQVHDRRRAGVPAARAAGAYRGGDRHARRRRLLPDRADGRRGRADPGARRHRLHARPCSSPASFMLCYVVFGGMVATTWVQIIKAVLLMAGITVMSIFVLGKVGFNPIELFNRAEANTTAECDVLARPGHVPAEADRHRVARPRARARHRRPAAHPDAVLHRPERQGGAQLGGVGDVPDRVLLPADHVHRLRRARVPRRGGVAAAGTAGNLAAPNLAAFLGGGEGTFGGDLFLAVIAGVAFATILAVVAGLVLSASAAVSHDVWSNIIRKGKDSEHEEVVVAKIAALTIGAHRHPRGRDRRLGPERLVHGRPRLRGSGQRQLPGAADGAHLAALQHHGRRRPACCSA